MAQLRDSHTSELIAEGTPTELVLLADSLGLKAGVVARDTPRADVEALDAIFDDVGAMDVDVVRRAHTERAEVLDRIAGDRKLDQAARNNARDQRQRVADLEARAKDTARQRDTRKRLDDARARRGRG